MRTITHLYHLTRSICNLRLKQKPLREVKLKLVFKQDEVAAALGKSEDEFIAMRESLEAKGFPKAVDALQDRWSIMKVIGWINAAD
jgi:hypothetical protein